MKFKIFFTVFTFFYVTIAVSQNAIEESILNLQLDSTNFLPKKLTLDKEENIYIAGRKNETNELVIHKIDRNKEKKYSKVYPISLALPVIRVFNVLNTKLNLIKLSQFGSLPCFPEDTTIESFSGIGLARLNTLDAFDKNTGALINSKIVENNSNYCDNGNQTLDFKNANGLNYFVANKSGFFTEYKSSIEIYDNDYNFINDIDIGNTNARTYAFDKLNNCFYAYHNSEHWIKKFEFNDDEIEEIGQSNLDINYIENFHKYKIYNNEDYVILQTDNKGYPNIEFVEGTIDLFDTDLNHLNSYLYSDRFIKHLKIIGNKIYIFSDQYTYNKDLEKSILFEVFDFNFNQLYAVNLGEKDIFYQDVVYNKEQKYFMLLGYFGLEESNGNYYLAKIDVNKLESEFTNPITKSMFEIDKNPIDKNFVVKINNFEINESYKLHIFNLNGSLVFEKKISNQLTYFEKPKNLTSGNYIFQLESNSNGESKKIIMY